MFDRRNFLLAAGAAATAGPWIALNASPAQAVSTGADLADSFAEPPPSARPWVYWFWINGNVTRQGVRADLEAMHRVGIGGVLVMDVDPGTPAGPVGFLSPAWVEMFQFAVDEAQRLGLEINLYNAAGWAGSAGPWITPELSMQKLVWSEIAVTGGARTIAALPRPEAVQGFYRDIAVLAFPTPQDDGYRIPFRQYSAGFTALDNAYLADQATAPLPLDPPALPAAMCIRLEDVRDISHALRDDRLEWEAPAGGWTVVRFGHTSTGMSNHPVAAAGLGLECDKLSRQAMQVHFDHFIGRILALQSSAGRKAIVSTHIDSWEMGDQNWTPGFEAEFRNRRGYELSAYLPAMTGRVMGDFQRTERFLWDLRLTISEMVTDNYAGELRRLAGQHGLRLSVEGYDGDPTDQMHYASQADEPQGEFWYGSDFFPEVHRSWNWCANMTSSAHVYGKPVVAAEAFTAMPEEKWQAHPALMKPLGDWAFSAGINRFIFHRYAMQPWLDRAPGMTMGAWGSHYERTQTWWEETGPWHAYLTRCQHMLRQGVMAADILRLAPEGAPMRYAAPQVDMRSGAPPETPGYNSDGCTPQAVFTRLSVRDGRIVLPDGMSYALLALTEPRADMPGAGLMTPTLLERLTALVEQGMTLVGPPPSRSPSLTDYPACDHKLAGLVDRLWGGLDGMEACERRVGLGRVVWGRSPEQVLAAAGVPVDFTSGDGEPFRYAHRRLPDGTDVYFVANRLDRELAAKCAFRVVGRSPQAWWPETGRITHPAVYDTIGGATVAPLRLQAHEAVFVVFPAGAASSQERVRSVQGPDGAPAPADIGADLGFEDGRIVRHRGSGGGELHLRLANGRTLELPSQAAPLCIEAPGPWRVAFTPGWGAPDHIDLASLSSWSEHPEPGVRHFSGRAVYTTAFTLPPRAAAHGQMIRLDLGRVEVMARVSVNGRDCGVVWKQPFILDITAAVRPGTNRLDITVVNLWPNRIIGDAALPEDCSWRPINFGDYHFGSTLTQWPQWLLDGRKSPTGRYTFSTWRLWEASAPLLPSGLLGPVLVYYSDR